MNILQRIFAGRIISRLQENNSEFSKRNEYLRSENDTLNAELEYSVQEINHLRAQLADVKRKYSDASSRLGGWMTKYASLERKYNELVSKK